MYSICDARAPQGDTRGGALDVGHTGAQGVHTCVWPRNGGPPRGCVPRPAPPVPMGVGMRAEGMGLTSLLLPCGIGWEVCATEYRSGVQRHTGPPVPQIARRAHRGTHNTGTQGAHWGPQHDGGTRGARTGGYPRGTPAGGRTTGGLPKSAPRHNAGGHSPDRIPRRTEATAVSDDPRAVCACTWAAHRYAGRGTEGAHTAGGGGGESGMRENWSGEIWCGLGPASASGRKK